MNARKMGMREGPWRLFCLAALSWALLGLGGSYRDAAPAHEARAGAGGCRDLTRLGPTTVGKTHRGMGDASEAQADR